MKRKDAVAVVNKVLANEITDSNYAELRKKIIAANGNEELYRQKQEEFNEIFFIA